MPRYHSRAERAADLLQSRRSTVESVAKQTGLPVDIVRQINEPIAKRLAEQDAVDAAGLAESLNARGGDVRRGLAQTGRNADAREAGTRRTARLH